MEERRGKPNTDPEWGTTPWDHFTKDQLLHEVRMMHSALIESKSVLAMAKHGDEHSPFWSEGGTGGGAWQLVKIALNGLDEHDGTSERIYRAFFRMAHDLLFGVNRHYWQVCEKCDVVLSQGGRAQLKCRECQVSMRPLEWRDVEPETKK